MANKLVRLLRNAIKIIHNQPKSCKECGLMTILNQKRYKASILIFKCLRGAAIPHFTTYINRLEHKYNKRGNLSTLCLPKARIEAAKSHLCFKVLFVTTKSQLTYQLELVNYVQTPVKGTFIGLLGFISI